MKKKLAIIISLILVAIFSVNLVAASYKDLDGHWAKDYIDDGGALELFDKREDGSFGANEKLSRAELIQAINRLTGVIEESDISFTDIKEDDPYYKEYKKAVYTGFIENEADKAEPKKLVSRSEAPARHHWQSARRGRRRIRELSQRSQGHGAPQTGCASD